MRCKKCRKHDLFAYNPNYEWTSYKTVTGMVLSYITVAFLIFYIGITFRDFVLRPPELVSQGDIDLLQVAREIPFRVPKVGLSLSYLNENTATGRVAALDNENPFVRFQFRHVVIKNQERVQEADLGVEDCIVASIPSQCPDENQIQNYRLQGTFFKEEFQFLEITVNKCTEDSSCAPLEDINEKIQSGEFRIRARLSLEAQQFDVEEYHNNGSGMAISNRSWEYFGIPNVELQSDIFLQARHIFKEERYAGSPPLPEIMIPVLSYDRRETNFRPRTANETNLLTFAIRLSDNVKLEEVSYWCPSILDLFGLWGAMTSFLVSLSLGFIALQYNKWHFHRHFKKAANQKRQVARRQTQASIEWIRNNRNTRNAQNMYDNLQTQYDALMVEPDIRLFETHHFDDEGRMAMSAAELKYPSTAFGELRRLAIMEHRKKKRAASFLSLWYARHLVKKGFIKDEDRKRELFASTEPVADDVGDTKKSERSRRGRGGFIHNVRQRSRRTKRPPTVGAEHELSGSVDDLESGHNQRREVVSSMSDDNTETNPSHSASTLHNQTSSSIAILRGDGSSVDATEYNNAPFDAECAQSAIAEMDFGTVTTTSKNPNDS